LNAWRADTSLPLIQPSHDLNCLAQASHNETNGATNMPSKVRLLLISASLLTFITGIGPVAAADNDSLQGVWVAQSMESDGNAAPKKAVERMRFTFKEDKLLVKGNFDDDREESCGYKIDATKSPKHLDFTPPKEEKPILAIYEINSDQLKLCLRHGGSSGGRPSDFSTKRNSGLVLIVFKRQKPE
jgi:uncharacterized protein (TIGR03067 family)